MRTGVGGATCRFDIEVFDSADAAVTGLVTGNFTKRLSIDGASDASTVTVTEVANGRYTVTFTAPAVAAGSRKYVRCWLLHATHAPRGWAEDFEVTNKDTLAASLAELSQAQPSATPDLADAIMLVYMRLRNRRDETTSQESIYNDAGVVIAKGALTDDATTFSKAKLATGP